MAEKFETDEKESGRPLELKRAFDLWYDSNLKAIIDDNRNRYQMELADAASRIERGMSALPSTKSTSIVDGYVENALLEYNQDPDAISFTSRSPMNPERDGYASILTADFIYRKENTSGFHLWQESSLRNGASDGIEAAFVHWVKESYKKQLPDTYFAEDGTEVPAEVYRVFKGTHNFTVQKNEQESVVRDTWVIDKLMPRRDVFWDPKIPVLDVNLGTYAGIMMPVTIEEILAYQERGIFDAEFTEEDIEERQANSRDGNDAATLNYGKSDTVDLGDKNRLEMMVFFEKRNFEWYVQFSLAGTFELSTFRPVNDVFYNGRQVNKLPIVVGYLKSRLWEATGVGFPEVIAPIEDELTDHRNNANDIAKQIAQGGKIRINPGADVDLDQVANARIYMAEKDDVEFTQYNPGLLESMRLDDARSQDIAALVPVGIADRSRQLSMKGSTKGLGLNQMAEQDSNSKLGVNLLVRNQTFFKPLLGLVAHLTMAYETDETVLAIAARNAGFELPKQIRNGREIIDISVFDFEVDVQVNAGMGSTPRYKKAQNIVQISEFRAARNIPTDWASVGKQLNVLAGFNATQFDAPPQTPPPPAVEYKATIAIDLAQLPQQAQQAMLDMMLSGGMDVTAKIDGSNPQAAAAQKINEQNGDGMALPERAATDMPDMRGEAGAAMSAGGEMNGL